MIKINKLQKIIGAVIITALVVAGVMYVWHLSVIRSIKQKKQELVQPLQSKDVKDVIIEGLNDRIDMLEEALLESKDGLPCDLLRIYTYNAHADLEGVGFCLAIPGHYSLTKKLKLAVDVLMKYKFKKGIIELQRIEQQADKKIAIVELRETKEDPGAWKGGYFQGSCGGHATTYILVNTFLQPDYVGKWIDGVEFYYEGKPISNDWDHIFLHGIKYRK